MSLRHVCQISQGLQSPGMRGIRSSKGLQGANSERWCEKANVAPRRSARDLDPGLESPGYRHGVAPRRIRVVDAGWNPGGCRYFIRYRGIILRHRAATHPSVAFMSSFRCGGESSRESRSDSLPVARAFKPWYPLQGASVAERRLPGFAGSAIDRHAGSSKLQGQFGTRCEKANVAPRRSARDWTQGLKALATGMASLRDASVRCLPTDVLLPMRRRIFSGIAERRFLPMLSVECRSNGGRAYNSPIINCARPLPKLQSASELTREIMTSLGRCGRRSAIRDRAPRRVSIWRFRCGGGW